jgi:nucleoside-diphosphate-sugar epimerase
MKEIKLGDLTPTRDMNYVKDVCRGFLSIAESNETIGREINISSNYEISVAGIFNLIKEIMKSEAKPMLEKERLRPITSEVYRLCGDNTLLKELTGFTTEYDINRGLELTCDWFKQKVNLLKYKSQIYNI